MHQEKTGVIRRKDLEGQHGEKNRPAESDQRRKRPQRVERRWGGELLQVLPVQVRNEGVQKKRGYVGIPQVKKPAREGESLHLEELLFGGHLTMPSERALKKTSDLI